MNTEFFQFVWKPELINQAVCKGINRQLPKNCLRLLIFLTVICNSIITTEDIVAFSCNNNYANAQQCNIVLKFHFYRLTSLGGRFLLNYSVIDVFVKLFCILTHGNDWYCVSYSVKEKTFWNIWTGVLLTLYLREKLYPVVDCSMPCELEIRSLSGETEKQLRRYSDFEHVSFVTKMESQLFRKKKNQHNY